MGARPYSPLLGRFLSVDPIDGGSLNDYEYVGADPINTTDLDGKCWICRKAKAIGRGIGRAAKAVGRGAAAVGKWAWRNKWDIALTGAMFIPGVGWAAAATHVARIAKWSNQGLRAIGVGGRGVGFGNARIALHAPHNVAKRHSQRAPLHAGRWHWHTGANRTARAIFRFWRIL